MSECRPPDGTPDGTVCWLFRYDGGGLIRERMPWRYRERQGWRPYWVQIGSAQKWLTTDMADYGWRFHSIAHPPGEHQPRETRDE